ncbi:choice-of-anchor K domain-containing protein [uncultured Roseobacter sp.]|uniref:choice-of-anchor K domain-containing protein n=1 Tax=uncultured Roseobacter sp. TaxID=114847 RepID=UPI0026291B0F|nr:choice-of-anchor K domain-containing protein [uncultured Roseobacter sp.]
MKKTLAISCVIAGLATGGSAATLFSGSTSGTFNDPGVSYSCTYSTAGGNGVAWGESGSCPDYGGSDEHSRLFVQNYEFSEQITGHEKVQIGQIKWKNEPNPSSKTTDFYAGLNLALNIDSPTVASFNEFLWNFIDNTPNPTGDRILTYRWDDYGLDIPYLLSGSLRIDGFSFALVGNTSGETWSESEYGSGLKFNWTNKENNWSKLAIYAEVSQVPLPAAGWMLIAAVGGLGAMRRKRKAS